MGNHAITKVLIKWVGASVDNNTWVSLWNTGVSTLTWWNWFCEALSWVALGARPFEE